MIQNQFGISLDLGSSQLQKDQVKNSFLTHAEMTKNLQHLGVVVSSQDNFDVCVCDYDECNQKYLDKIIDEIGENYENQKIQNREISIRQIVENNCQQLSVAHMFSSELILIVVISLVLVILLFFEMGYWASYAFSKREQRRRDQFYDTRGQVTASCLCGNPLAEMLRKTFEKTFCSRMSPQTVGWLCEDLEFEKKLMAENQKNMSNYPSYNLNQNAIQN